MNALFEARKYMSVERAWQAKYGLTAPRQGDAAPDFKLWDLKGESCIRLSDFRHQKPVALVFGSFT